MRTSFFVIAAIALLVSCKKSELKSDQSQSMNSDLLIKAGYDCGWGTGTDSIEILKSLIRFAYYIPAKSPMPQIKIARAVPDSEWTGIINDVNYNDFVKMQYNSCNICVDGCDEWILIKTGQLSHQIRFGKGMKIDTISKLQDKLAQLRAEFMH